MPAIVRLGDLCSGHGCWPPRPNITASANVFVNGIGAHRLTDHWPTHCCDRDCHEGITIGASPTVYVNGLPVARIGDPIDCGSYCMQGSVNVFAG